MAYVSRLDVTYDYLEQKTRVVREAHRAKAPLEKFPIKADNVDARLIKDVRP